MISCKGKIDLNIQDDGANATFLALMENELNDRHSNLDGIALDVVSEEKDVAWNGVVGFDSKKKTDKLHIDQPFRIASVTKTFVAASILRLHEMDSLSIDEPIDNYISEQHKKILLSDGYKPNEIRIRHCLNHTSGLYDYAMGGSPYVGIVKQNPKKRWTRTDQLEFAVQHGDKLGYPGEKYAYSDTGYILLGEIIETFHNGDLAKGIRELVGFENLNMYSTWLETLEEKPDNMRKQVGRYLQNVDALEIDPSTDLYGGGGLVSTVMDLRKFMHGLFNGKVFQNDSTLDLMLEKPNYDPTYDTKADRRFKDYRHGLWRISLMGKDAYIHSGLWGIHLIHQPHSNSTLAVNYTRGFNDALVKRCFMAINEIDKS